MKDSAKTFWTSDRIMHLIIGLAITACLVWLVRYLSDVLLPFFVACAVAYLLQPLVRFNQRITHIHTRTIPSILSLLEILIVLAGLGYLFLPSVISETDVLGDIIKKISDGRLPIPREFVPLVQFVDRYVSPAKLHEMLSTSHIETLITKGTSFLEGSIEVIMQTLGWLLTLIYILFILIDYPQITRGFKLIVPHKYRPQAMEVVHEVQNNLNHYFRGQGVVALCAAVFYCSGFSIVHLPLAIPMGILVGILYMIPYFQYVTLIPVAVICFIYSLGGNVSFLPMIGECLLVYVVSQSICDYLITPHIMGREMGLNPAIILLSLSVWGSLLGIIGMIIALPVSALIMTYYERYISEPRTAADTKQVEIKSPDEADS